jgi:tRNA (guanine-N7-)-methyltransferase
VKRSTSPADISESAIRFYGRRKGKPLKVQRQSLIETLLPNIRIAVSDGVIDPASLFSFAPESVRLEVGFGAGEHLANQAGANPTTGFIGSEVFLNGVASLLRHVNENKLSNVRVFDEDARFLLPALRDNSLARISLMFPDPWPKARHAKRRFVNPAMLDHCARLLRDEGELRVASDHTGYIRWTLSHATIHPAFRWTVRGPEDWRIRPADSTPTRYEGKALAAGRHATFLTFKRLARTP